VAMPAFYEVARASEVGVSEPPCSLVDLSLTDIG
jgi:hypothetical protein